MSYENSAKYERKKYISRNRLLIDVKDYLRITEEQFVRFCQ